MLTLNSLGGRGGPKKFFSQYFVSTRLESFKPCVGGTNYRFQSISFFEFQFFAMSNRKKHVKGTLQIENMQNVSLQIKFGKKPVANFGIECAFLLPRRKIHCAAILWSGSAEVAAGLSNLAYFVGARAGALELKPLPSPQALSQGTLCWGSSQSAGAQGPTAAPASPQGTLWHWCTPLTPWSGVAVDLGRRKVVKSIVNSTI